MECLSQGDVKPIEHLLDQQGSWAGWSRLGLNNSKFIIVFLA